MTFIFTAQTVSRLFGAPTQPIYDLQSLIDRRSSLQPKQSAVSSASTVSDRSVIVSMAQTVSYLFGAYSL